jgi:aspartate/methionine/tyrosine aminotransferase
MGEHRARIQERMEYCLNRIAEIDGIDCEAPGGAFYLFVRITDPELAVDDKRFVLDLLHQHHVLLVHGSGFSPEFGQGHFRMVCLPSTEILAEAFDRIESFLRR